MKTRFREESGQTLLELMFASGILAMALAMLFGSLISLTALGRMAESREIASNNLSIVMEELRGCTYQQLLAYVPPAVDGLGTDAAAIVECFNEDGVAILLPLGSESGEGEGEGEGEEADMAELANSLPNPLEVQTTITWLGDRGRAYTLSASTLFWR